MAQLDELLARLHGQQQQEGGGVQITDLIRQGLQGLADLNARGGRAIAQGLATGNREGGKAIAQGFKTLMTPDPSLQGGGMIEDFGYGSTEPGSGFDQKVETPLQLIPRELLSMNEQGQPLPPVKVEQIKPAAQPAPQAVSSPAPQQIPVQDVTPQQQPQQPPRMSTSAPATAAYPGGQRVGMPAPMGLGGPPPQAAPQQRRQMPAAVGAPSDPSFGQYVSGALQGAASANNPLGMLFGLLGGAVGAGEQVNTKNNLYKTLVANGVKPQEAALYVMSPQASQWLAQRQGTQGKFGKIGQDANGNDQYGFYNERTGEVTPYQMPPGMGPMNLGGENKYPAAIAGSKKGREQWDKEEATRINKLRSAAPQGIVAADDSIASIDALLQDPGFNNIFGTVAGQTPDLLPDSIRAARYFDRIKGQQFLNGVQLMRGLGPLSDREGAAVASSQSSLDRRLDPESARRELLAMRERLVRMKKIAIDQGREAGIDLTGGGGGQVGASGRSRIIGVE